MGERREGDRAESAESDPRLPEVPDGFDLGLRTGRIPTLTDHVLGHGGGLGDEIPDRHRMGPEELDGAFAIGPNGERLWGRFGAAGILAIDRRRGVLVQHRAPWSSHGGTWGIPGGALDEGETALEGALREADEEASLPPDAIDPLFERVVDLGFWSYTTIGVEMLRRVRAAPRDEETAGLAWIAPREVERLRLHPRFAEAWPTLRPLLAARAELVVDAANVVGSVPDGWWKDRPGAAERLGKAILPVLEEGFPAARFGMDAARVWPRVTLVLEGAANRARMPEHPRLEVVRAPGHGDDAVVESAAAAVARARSTGGTSAAVLVVTSDRRLRVRVGELGVATMTSRTFRDRVPVGPGDAPAA